jgi:spermidine/putrescine transport system permease protein
MMRQATPLLAPALLWVLAFFLLPFAGMIALSFAHMEGREVVPGLSGVNYLRFWQDAAIFRGLVVSLEITAVVTLLSVLLAYPLAWIIATRVPERWQRLALILAVLPFWTSYVVRSYAWLLVLGQNGVLNKALQALHIIAEPLEIASTRAATVIGFVHFFAPPPTLGPGHSAHSGTSSCP